MCDCCSSGLLRCLLLIIQFLLKYLSFSPQSSPFQFNLFSSVLLQQTTDLLKCLIICWYFIDGAIENHINPISLVEDNYENFCIVLFVLLLLWKSFFLFKKASTQIKSSLIGKLVGYISKMFAINSPFSFFKYFFFFFFLVKTIKLKQLIKRTTTICWN